MSLVKLSKNTPVKSAPKVSAALVLFSTKLLIHSASLASSLSAFSLYELIISWRFLSLGNDSVDELL